jgi:hypothetical protein
MSETLMKIVVDCSTGEQTEVALTEEEIAQFETDRISAEKEAKAREAEEAARAAAKQAAQDKLKGLGLTDLEIAAITGA